MVICTALCWVSWLLVGCDEPPEVVLKADDTEIKESCRIVVPKDAVIEDKNGDGVIQLRSSNITVEFAKGSILRGASEDAAPDTYQGFGIRIDGQTGVTIRGARVQGYRCGIYATRADGLTLRGCDASGCYRARLGSTPAAEDEADWLYPHHNDDNEWLKNYGAAIYVEDSNKVTVRRCRVREGQNGLCLDRVNDSRVYDNDFSFLSGWGIAMWRSSRNVISRNYLDFCVRGYSHGVYNRGQDSAGILAFEQCCENVFAENSATHCGDGFFGFAGREAIGEAPPPTKDFDYKRRGCNDNLLIDNDFSYAAAHGIEITFSFGNRILSNRLAGNAICGVWGGYSQDTLIAGNKIESNGGMAYGLERGGVNIEHGRNNRTLHNWFFANKCGVHLWWDDDGDFAKEPWGLANGTDSVGNVIAANTFGLDSPAMHFRGPGDAVVGPNEFLAVGEETRTDSAFKARAEPKLQTQEFRKPQYLVYGKARPAAGPRPSLEGRHDIIMTEWGPWDHASPLLRLVDAHGSAHVYELRKLPFPPVMTLDGPGVSGAMDTNGVLFDGFRYIVSAKQPGAWPYRMTVRSGSFGSTVASCLLSTQWQVTFFPWKTDPREDLEGWRAEAKETKARSVTTDGLTFKFASGGPGELLLPEGLTIAQMGGDHFGMIARTSLPLRKGKWKLATRSDDGIRVTVDGKPIIDNWTWHVPTRDEGALELEAERTVEIVVEYFELDGYATLEFEITPHDSAKSPRKAGSERSTSIQRQESRAFDGAPER